MNKSLIRQQPPGEPTFSIGVSPMILLKWKADYCTPLSFACWEAFGPAVWEHLITLGKTLSWAGTRLHLGKHDHSWPHLQQYCMTNTRLPEGALHALFSLWICLPSISNICIILLYTVGWSIIKMSFPIQLQISLTAHFPWTAKEQKSLTRNFVWIHDTGQESIPSSLQGWTTRHFSSSYCE